MDNDIARTETSSPPRHPAWRFPALVVFGSAVIVACSSSSKDPTAPQAGPPTAISANSSTAQTGLIGQSVNGKPSVKVTDINGIGVPDVTVTFTVTSGGGSLTGGVQTTNSSGVATVGGWTLGAAPGANTMTAAASGVPGTVIFNASGGSVLTNFAIQLLYKQTPTTAQANAFNGAAARWAEVITGDLGSVNIGSFTTAGFCGSTPVSGTVNDVLIIVDLKPNDGPGGVLGAATLCYIRDSQSGDPSPGMPLIGYMFFDTADLAALQTTGRLDDVILHEMGHVLGIGTMWEAGGNSLVTNTLAATGSTLGFTGANAINAYKTLNGAPSAVTVPVEDTNVVGTARAHWKEGVLKNELMTGYLSGTLRPLSATTIGSLADLGYVVDLGAADPFNITTAGLRADGASDPPPLDLRNDVIPVPRQYLDRTTGFPRRP